MAVCEYCDREMRTADGCTLATYDDFGDDVTYQRIRYGAEPGWWESVRAIDPEFEPPESCHDCGALLGELHHPRCDMEACPRCGGQAISCQCPIMDAASPRLPRQERAER